MRRTTPLLLLLAIAALVVMGTAGFALAQGVGTPGSLSGTLGTLRAAPPSPTGRPITPVSAVPTVTAPALTGSGLDPVGAVASGAAAGASAAVNASTGPSAPAGPAAPPPAGTATAPAAEPPPAPAPAPPTDVSPPYATVLGWHGEDRVAYLTFDDGPGPYTC